MMKFATLTKFSVKFIFVSVGWKPSMGWCTPASISSRSRSSALLTGTTQRCFVRFGKKSEADVPADPAAGETQGKEPGALQEEINNEKIAKVAKRMCEQLGDKTPTPATKKRCSLKRNAAAAPQQKSALSLLKNSSVAEPAGKSCASITISTVIYDLHEANLSKGAKETLRSVSLSHLGEKDKFRAALELVECVVTDEQWNLHGTRRQGPVGYCKSD